MTEAYLEKLRARIAELERQLAEERACVDWYARPESWNYSPESTFMTDVHSDQSLVKARYGQDVYGGKRAREQQARREK